MRRTERSAKRMPQKVLNRPVFSVVVAPLERAAESPLYSKLIAVVVGGLTALQQDILFLVMLALLFANFWDFVAGRGSAQHRGEVVNADTARAGALTKMSGVVLVLLTRMLEYWGERFEIPILSATHGAIAASFCVTLILFDMESIEGHRVELGARPIPGLSQLMSVLRKVEAWLLRAISTPPPYIPPPPAPEGEPE